jgi:hypothetical protein
MSVVRFKSPSRGIFSAKEIRQMRIIYRRVVAALGTCDQEGQVEVALSIVDMYGRGAVSLDTIVTTAVDRARQRGQIRQARRYPSGNGRKAGRAKTARAEKNPPAAREV